jgi:hypothetical protein
MFVIFSDKIEMFYEKSKENWVKVPLLRTGIAWSSDKHKFANPKKDGQSLEQGKPFKRERRGEDRG